MKTAELTTAVPDRGSLRHIRERIGLSQSEFAAAIGMRNPGGEYIVRRWEKEEDQKPSPTAWHAIRYLVMVVDLYRATPDGESRNRIAALLPECLR